MHLMLFFIVGISVSPDINAELNKLESCWNKSLELLDKAKSDLDGNYDHDPWFLKHQQQSLKCNAIKESLKKNGVVLVPCYIQPDRKFRCEVLRAPASK